MADAFARYVRTLVAGMRDPPTDRELARRAKIPQGTFSKAMLGKRPPPLDKIVPLARALGCDDLQRDVLIDLALRSAGLADVADLLSRTRSEVVELMRRLSDVELAMGRRVAEPRSKRDH